MAENKNFNISVKKWNTEKKQYVPEEFVESSDKTIRFAGLTIELFEEPPILVPSDVSRSIIIRNELSERNRKSPLYVYEQRKGQEKPQSYVVGETILVESPYFCFSALTDLVYIQIYEGKPDENIHPDMMEIVPVSSIKEAETGKFLL